ncbi:MAG: DUF4442 domain-containing protein [Deltaproteobacteria bacterium]|nr:MAG: DUF4442 domain-containing protein [Deltaproteobacteria bacterium]
MRVLSLGALSLGAWSKRLLRDPKWLRRILNLYPPYLGAGVVVRQIRSDFREVVVEMPLRFYNRNYVGTHFGGNLYSMVDPFYMLMLIQILGEGYVVWDQAAKIVFEKPGRGRVWARLAVTEGEIETIRRESSSGRPYRPTFVAQIRDASGEVVATVEKTLYVRRKMPRGLSSEARQAPRPESDRAAAPGRGG